MGFTEFDTYCIKRDIKRIADKLKSSYKEKTLDIDKFHHPPTFE